MIFQEQFIDPHINIEELNVWYAAQQALNDITVSIPRQKITAIIGPSGCGKTTLLRSFNRLLEQGDQVRIEGKIYLDGTDIYSSEMDVTDLRTRVGLLAPKPYPLPMSIYDNVAYGRRLHGLDIREKRTGRRLDRAVERFLRAAGLWKEVKDRLQESAEKLSSGQQQRLCLARALAVEPEILLCDEPTSALDPISAQGIEEQLMLLKEETTIVLVTHMLRQANRLADHIIFLWMGNLVESGTKSKIFSHPQDPRTKAYFGGEIG